MKDSPITIPIQLDPDHIERTLANSNELIARTLRYAGAIPAKKPRQDGRDHLPYVDQVIYLPSGGRVFGGGYGV